MNETLTDPFPDKEDIDYTKPDFNWDFVDEGSITVDEGSKPNFSGF